MQQALLVDNFVLAQEMQDAQFELAKQWAHFSEEFGPDVGEQVLGLVGGFAANALGTFAGAVGGSLF